MAGKPGRSGPRHQPVEMHILNGTYRADRHGPIPTTNDPSPVEEFDAPDDLAADERKIWLRQAPFAFKQRTLTRATALSFERYCKLVIMERAEAASSARGGANHRGLLKQINTLEQQFKLTANGKAIYELHRAPVAPGAAPTPPANPLARFRKTS